MLDGKWPISLYVSSCRPFLDTLLLIRTPTGCRPKWPGSRLRSRMGDGLSMSGIRPAGLCRRIQVSRSPHGLGGRGLCALDAHTVSSAARGPRGDSFRQLVDAVSPLCGFPRTGSETPLAGARPRLASEFRNPIMMDAAQSMAPYTRTPHES